MGFSKKLPSSVELWLMSLRSAALVEDSDLGCRFVWPPSGGIVAGARCGMQGDPHPHEYFGPGSIKKETCAAGHVYPVATAYSPPNGCQFCSVEKEYPGWRPRLKGWQTLPPEMRP
jgi:hypothetical protein